jgi:hypothetical protein
MLATSASGSQSDSELLGRIAELQTRYPNKRAPQLALVAHAHAQFEEAVSVSDSSSDEQARLGTALVDAIIAYVEKFGSKQCCFDDLRNFMLVFIPVSVRPQVPASLSQNEQAFRACRGAVAQRPLGEPIADELQRIARERRWPLDLIGSLAVGDEQRSALIGQLRELACDSVNLKHKDSQQSEQVRALRKFTTCYQVLKFVGVFEDFSVEETFAEINKLFNEYEDTKAISEADNAGDDLILLVAHLITDLGVAFEYGAQRVTKDPTGNDNGLIYQL